MKRVILMGTMCLMALTLRAVNDGPEPGYVDLGLSVKWATCNLGASKPEGYGEYYAWGETEPYYSSQDPLTWKEGKGDGYRWASYKWSDGSYTSLNKYNTESKYGNVDDKTVLEEADDVARVLLGGNWRIPTDAEWTELRTECTWTATTQNGMPGYKVTGKANGNSIFLPCAGYRDGKSQTADERGGYYWSSSLDTGFPYNAWRVYFGSYDSSKSVCRCSGIRYIGFSVRPVCEQ